MSALSVLVLVAGILILAVVAIAAVAWLIIGALGVAQIVGGIVEDYRRKADDE